MVFKSLFKRHPDDLTFFANSNFRLDIGSLPSFVFYYNTNIQKNNRFLCKIQIKAESRKIITVEIFSHHAIIGINHKCLANICE